MEPETLPGTCRVDASDLVARIAALESHAAKTSERLTALESEAPTVDIDPPAPEPTPEPPRPIDPSLPTDKIDAGDVNAQLAKHDRVEIPGGATINGGLVCPRDWTELVCVDGEFPVIIPARNQNAITITSQKIQRLLIEGIGAQSNHKDQARGIAARLNGNEGKFAKKVTIRNNRLIGFDSGVELVDDWARKQGEGVPGRFGLDLFELNMIGPSYGDDSHSVGLYIEGLDEGAVIRANAFDKSGWDEPKERNKRSHSIYAQSYGAPVLMCSDNLFRRAAANAAQWRAGCRGFVRNIISECSLGPWFDKVPVLCEDNVILDQTDIQPRGEAEGNNPNADIRGHGFIFSHSGHTIRRNLAARRNGSQERVPAFKEIRKSSVENNVAVDWAVDHFNFDIDGTEYTDTGTNQTIASDPGVPKFTQAWSDRFMLRKRGGVYAGAGEFRDLCWGAIG